MLNIEKYLDINDEDFDNLILNFKLEEDNNLFDKIEKVDKISRKNCYSDITYCKLCKSSNLITNLNNYYLVCDDCGVINKEFLDERPDNNQSENEGSSRYGPCSSIFFKQSSLGSKIASKGYSRLSQLQNQGQMPYKEKSLMDVLEIIQLKCKKYYITQPIIDSAKISYKKISESVHYKGKRKGKNIIMRCINRSSMIAACLFYACKRQKEIRSSKEIADIFDLEIKHVNRGIRKYFEIDDDVKQIKSSESFDFIERYTKPLNLNKNYIDILKDVTRNSNKLDLCTKHEPISIAAGCLLLVVTYYALPISKKKIADIFNKLSDVTLSKTFREIWPYHKIVLSNTITNLILEKKNSLNDYNLNNFNNEIF